MQLKSILCSSIGQIEIIIDNTMSTITEPHNNRRGIFYFGCVFMCHPILKTSYLGYRGTHDPFQNIQTMRPHIKQAPTMTDRRILTPRPRNRRIPARQLCTPHHHLPQTPRLNQLTSLLMIHIIPHTKTEHKHHTRLLARLLDLLHLLNSDSYRFFAKNMLAGPCRLNALTTMNILRRRNIDGVDIFRQQCLLCVTVFRHTELPSHFLSTRQINIHHRNKLGIGHHRLKLRNRAPSRYPTAPNNTPSNHSRHCKTLLVGWVTRYPRGSPMNQLTKTIANHCLDKPGRVRSFAPFTSIPSCPHKIRNRQLRYRKKIIEHQRRSPHSTSHLTHTRQLKPQITRGNLQRLTSNRPLDRIQQ